MNIPIINLGWYKFFFQRLIIGIWMKKRVAYNTLQGSQQWGLWGDVLIKDILKVLILIKKTHYNNLDNDMHHGLKKS